jgi:cellulose synthase/poly-beta-1,6-N-acetylglucosamine synthase-like glycosyltransferase
MAIVIASDGSTDGTIRQARDSEAGNLTVLDFRERRGKAATLVHAIRMIDAEIILFTDATSYFNSDAVKNLARHFSDESVGIVSGRVCMLTESGLSAEGLYWKLESSVRQSEAKLGVVTGVSGAIYAIRRSMFVEPECPTINDDMVFPILAKQKHGCRFVLDNEAVAEVVVSPSLRHEFRRRRRIGLGVFQSLRLLWPAIWNSDRLSVFALLSHKVLRWTVPLALILALVSNLILLGHALYQVAFGVLLLSILAAILGLFCTSASMRWARWFGVATSFYSMNIALLLGFVDWLFWSKKVVWEPTTRPERSTLAVAALEASPSKHLRHGPSI